MNKLQDLPAGLEVQGRYREGFEEVVTAFSSNLAAGEEFGAACAVYVRGELVVDIWGGVSEPTSAQPWRSDTMVVIHSVTKGVAAVCVLHLVDQGLLRLDEPVSTYWPEFAAHGKEAVTVRNLLAHRAGVPYVEGEVTLADLRDPKAMAGRLAAQRPVFEPGSTHAYHALTIGWLTSELVRRVTGESIGVWFARHLAAPLGLDMYIGLPQAERHRVARLGVATPEQLTSWPKIVPPDSLAWKVVTLNGLLHLVPGFGGLDFNDFRLQSTELAGAGMIADARSLAKFYAACIGDMGMPRLLSAATIADASKPVSTGIPFDTEFPGASWGAGVMIPWSIQPMLGPASFGHDGYGGSLAFADPESEVAFAYVRNRIAVGGVKDPAVYKVVDAVRQLV
ncbi:serine hydrolase domain-containing protein [Massilia sp. GER05]|uniref:serine hydrolase domain-containing protein n=1 Tax=Massilia sp. GER05 TaxID=3394605 RepID=UPI003F87C102